MATQLCTLANMKTLFVTGLKKPTMYENGLTVRLCVHGYAVYSK